MTETDVIVIGGGIAGASLAAVLSRDAKVVLLEKESHPGYHSTGRSAAVFILGYGNEVIQAFNEASADFFRSPPDRFSDVPLMTPQSMLTITTAESTASLPPHLPTVALDRMHEFVPLLKRDVVTGIALDEDCGSLDVDALLQAHLREFRNNGGDLFTNHAVTNINRQQGRWQVSVNTDHFSAPVVVNASGAWADQTAQMAGLEPLGLMPLRRTAMLLDPPEGVSVEDWPLVNDIDEKFYCKSDAGKLLLSPADETPSEPMDAFAEELDIAIAVERMQQVMDFPVDRVTHSWAGLRTFATDRSLVIGFDPRVEGFFWVAGQGGYGVQTSPAVSEFAARLIGGKPVQSDLTNIVAAVAPDRLIN